MGWRPSTWAAAALVVLVAGCTSSPSDRSPPQSTPAPASARASAPSTQQVVYRGVSIDVPASWPHNRVECSRPLADTVVVEPASGFGCLDSAAEPRDLGQVSYAWMGSYLEHLERRSILGGATITSHFLTTLRDDTLAGEHVRVHGGRLPDGRHLRLVQFPRRRTYLTVVSQRPSLVRAVVRSVRLLHRDPRGGCLVHTHRFDDGLTRQGDAPTRRMVSGDPTSALACRYLDGWLENAATLRQPATRRLVHALNEAPPTTAEHRRREWPGCLYVSNTFHVPTLPVAMSFHYRDGGTAVVVARPVYCTSLQSYVTNGARTRRLDAPITRLLPRDWNILSADV